MGSPSCHCHGGGTRTSRKGWPLPFPRAPTQCHQASLGVRQPHSGLPTLLAWVGAVAHLRHWAHTLRAPGPRACQGRGQCWSLGAGWVGESETGVCDGEPQWGV